MLLVYLDFTNLFFTTILLPLQVISLQVRSYVLEGKGVITPEECRAHERKGMRLLGEGGWVRVGG